MPKEILLYSGINEYSSTEFINSVNELEPTDELVVRVNTKGGNPEYGWGMVAKFAEFKGKKSIKVDGQAHSMGLMFLAYADNIEVLDVAEGVLHRAAYPDWFESSDYFTEALKGNLERINSSLMTAFKNKVDVAKFEELKGVKLKQVFSMDDRIDVFLTAQDMKKIGLVDKINKITPKKAASLVAIGNQDKSIVNLAAEYIPEATQDIKDKPKNNKQMTIEDLKANHVEVYNKVFNLGSEAGIAERNDTVNAWLTFNDVDAKAVSEGIKSGDKLSQAKSMELMRKEFSKDALAKEEKGAALDVAPVEDDKPEADAKSAAEVELDALLNNDKK